MSNVQSVYTAQSCKHTKKMTVDISSFEIQYIKVDSYIAFFIVEPPQ